MLTLYRASTTNNLVADSPAIEKAGKALGPKTPLPNKRFKKTPKSTGKLY
jgi:hypothetical protein